MVTTKEEDIWVPFVLKVDHHCDAAMKTRKTFGGKQVSTGVKLGRLFEYTELVLITKITNARFKI